MTTKWKLAKGKTWRQKLEEEHPNHGKVVAVPPAMRKRFGTAPMLIPRPMDVDAVMRKVKKGKLVTQSQIRARLAKESQAECSCPLTTGIFLRIAAEAAEEDRQAGKKRITPYWRTIKDDGKLNEKFPGGVRAQAARLRQEGFTLQPGRGKQPPRVKDFQKYLIRLSWRLQASKSEPRARQSRFAVASADSHSPRAMRRPFYKTLFRSVAACNKLRADGDHSTNSGDTAGASR